MVRNYVLINIFVYKKCKDSDTKLSNLLLFLFSVFSEKELDKLLDRSDLLK